MPAQCPNVRMCHAEQGLWTPAALRPSIWVKSNAAKTIIVSGGVVTSVIDVSSGVPFSVTGSVGLDTSQLNNKPTLRLDNTSTAQLLTASYSYAGNEITLISLHRNAATAGGSTVYGRLFSLYKTGELDYGTVNGGILTYGVGGVNGVRFYRNTNTNVTSSPTINDVWGCAVLTRSGTGLTMALDGGSRVAGTTASNSFNFDKVRIGNDDGPRADSGMNGYIAENILITRAITQEEEDRLFGYLAWEWGRVTSLPIGHPYRFAPPRDNRILTRKRRAFLFMAAAGGGGTSSYSLTASAGSFTESGQSAILTATRVLPQGAGSFTLTGQSAALVAGRATAAGAASFVLSGKDAGLPASRTMAGGAGSFSLSGQDAAPIAGRVLAASAASVVLTGQAANLTYTPTGSYTLTAEAGSVLLSGQSSSLTAARTVPGDAAAFAMSGGSVGLIRSYPLTAGEGSFAISGQVAGIVRGAALTAESGSVSVTGYDAGFISVRILSASVATFTLTGQAASFSAGIAQAIGTAAASGPSASFLLLAPLTSRSYRLLETVRDAAQSPRVAAVAGVSPEEWSSLHVFVGLGGKLNGRSRGRCPFVEIDQSSLTYGHENEGGGFGSAEIVVRVHLSGGMARSAWLSDLILATIASEIRTSGEAPPHQGDDTVSAMVPGPWGCQRDMSLRLEFAFERDTYGVTADRW